MKQKNCIENPDTAALVTTGEWFSMADLKVVACINLIVTLQQILYIRFYRAAYYAVDVIICFTYNIISMQSPAYLY